MKRRTSRPVPFRRLLLILLAFPFCSISACAAPPPVHYRAALPEPQTQMVNVSVQFDGLTDDVLEVMLPTWRPGRYEILDPAGTVQDVRAAAIAPDGSEAAELAIRKRDKSTWRVQTQGFSSVRIHYRIYANSIADRTRHVDDSHAFLSGSSVFMYAPQRRAHPLLVTIDAPAGWEIASGLDTAPGRSDTLMAADYDVLVDSPIEVGLHDRMNFEVRGVTHEIVIWPPDLRYDADRLRRDFATIVSATAELFGELPYTRYVFIIHAGAGGGGTEHLNSTIMQTSIESLRESLYEGDRYTRFLSLVAHEFFHTWNVKQLRPAGLQPYDYQRENYSRLLWVVEGTTSYYDELLLARTRLVAESDYLRTLGSSIDSLRNRPGAFVQSLEESSFDAWIKFNKASSDANNSTVSFYQKGALVSLLLDLQLREHTAGDVSLDDMMCEMYRRFPLSGPGYTTEDLLIVLEELSGTSFRDFFERFVEGTEELPLEQALNTVGLELHLKPAKARNDDESEDEGEEADPHRIEDDSQAREAPEAIAWLGLTLTDAGGRTQVRAVRSDGPAYRAGVIAGDEVVALDGLRLEADELQDRLRVYESGDVVTLHLLRRDALRSIEITLGEKLDGKWSVRRLNDASEKQKQAFASWLGQEWESRPEGSDGSSLRLDARGACAASDEPRP